MSAMPRQSFGTGRLELRMDEYERENYGRFSSTRRQVKRNLGPKRKPGEARA